MHDSTFDLFRQDADETFAANMQKNSNKKQQNLKLLLITTCRSFCELYIPRT